MLFERGLVILLGSGSAPIEGHELWSNKILVGPNSPDPRLSKMIFNRER